MHSGRPLSSKSYQKLTPDPNITSEFKRNDHGKFNTTQVMHLICHGVMNSPINFSPPDILVYVI